MIHSLNLQSVRTGMYGRSVLTLTRNSSGIGSSGAHIKTGDEVRIFNPQLRNTPQEAAATIEGVVLHCNTGPSKADALKSASSDPSSHTGLVIEVAVSGEEEVDETLLASAASGLRLDLIANDATHSKMMNALNDLESVARTGCMTSRSGASGGGNVSPAAPLVSLLFGQAYERALTRTSRRQAPPAAALGGSGSARAPLPVDAAARIRPFGPINPSQVEAIENALQAPLLACIHGPPGTLPLAWHLGRCPSGSRALSIANYMRPPHLFPSFYLHILVNLLMNRHWQEHSRCGAHTAVRCTGPAPAGVRSQQRCCGLTC